MLELHGESVALGEVGEGLSGVTGSCRQPAMPTDRGQRVSRV